MEVGNLIANRLYLTRSSPHLKLSEVNERAEDQHAHKYEHEQQDQLPVARLNSQLQDLKTTRNTP